MSGLSFLHRDAAHLHWPVLLLLGLAGWAELRHEGSLARLLSAVMQRRLASRLSPFARAARVGLMSLALLCAVFALMGPETPGEPGPAPTATGG